MKFIISRANWDKDNKCPINGAILETLSIKHCNKFGNITERMESEWIIEIKTLEDLSILQAKSGSRIIITFPKNNKSESDYGHITIYDGYIE